MRVRVARDVRRAEERASFISPRRALFTASSLGKTFATCGSSTITFVEVRTRLAYLPRTNSPRSDRLYSGRSQSLSSDLPFFINFPLKRKPRALLNSAPLYEGPIQTSYRNYQLLASQASNEAVCGILGTYYYFQVQQDQGHRLGRSTRISIVSPDFVQPSVGNKARPHSLHTWSRSPSRLPQPGHVEKSSSSGRGTPAVPGTSSVKTS